MKKSLFILALSLSSTLLPAATVVSDEKTLISAMHAANLDQSITEIIFAKNAQIKLLQPVIYSGSQNLSIRGNNAVIDGSSAGSFSINKDLTAITADASLIFNSAGALKITDLSIINSATRGLVVNIPEDATGADVSIILHNINITGSALYGLHIDDNSHEFDDGQTGSEIGINIVIENSHFTGNGVGAIDFDGVRVDERSQGSIVAFITNTVIDGNGGDGIELDEAGNGDIEVTMIDVSVSNNGFYNQQDLDDGFDIDEAGSGDIIATLINVVVDNNLDEGLDFDESGSGDLIAKLYNVSGANNRDEGIKMDEEDDGNIRTILSRVTVNSSGDDGIQLTETGKGFVNATLSQVNISDSAKLGFKAQMWLVEDEPTVTEQQGSLQILDLNLSNNAKGDAAGIYNLEVH